MQSFSFQIRRLTLVCSLKDEATYLLTIMSVRFPGYRPPPPSDIES